MDGSKDFLQLDFIHFYKTESADLESHLFSSRKFSKSNRKRDVWKAGFLKPKDLQIYFVKIAKIERRRWNNCDLASYYYWEGSYLITVHCRTKIFWCMAQILRLILSILMVLSWNHTTLGHWHSTARVNRRLPTVLAACLRARYCARLARTDLKTSSKHKMATTYCCRKADADSVIRVSTHLVNGFVVQILNPCFERFVVSQSWHYRAFPGVSFDSRSHSWASVLWIDYQSGEFAPDRRRPSWSGRPASPPSSGDDSVVASPLIVGAVGADLFDNCRLRRESVEWLGAMSDWRKPWVADRPIRKWPELWPWSQSPGLYESERRQVVRSIHRSSNSRRPPTWPK